nr:hypothetical protein [Rhodococcus sp. SMB37]
MDLLRWFRFLWAIDVAWSSATQREARDFCRWMLLAGKPIRPHWRTGSSEQSAASSGKPYSASVRAHSETVLLLLPVSSRISAWTDHQSVSVGSVGARLASTRAPQSDGPVRERAHGRVSPDGAVSDTEGGSRRRVQRDLRPAAVAS